eukprot:812610-Pyramimonas_sp.AAC.1
MPHHLPGAGGGRPSGRHDAGPAQSLVRPVGQEPGPAGASAQGLAQGILQAPADGPEAALAAEAR